MLTTPPSLTEEHEEIMGSLDEFSRLRDETGKSVKELVDVLEPHFGKEERLAMPVLGTLSEASLEDQTSTNLRAIAESQAALREEYDNMFVEHAELRTFIQNAGRFAKQEDSRSRKIMKMWLTCWMHFPIMPESRKKSYTPR